MKHCTLFIDQMVCPRCIKVVRDELAALDLDIVEITMGKVVYQNPENIDSEYIFKALSGQGFGVLGVAV